MHSPQQENVCGAAKWSCKELAWLTHALVKVRAWLARVYSIPGCVSQWVGGQTPAFCFARGLTQSHATPDWVPLGLVRPCQGTMVVVRILVVLYIHMGLLIEFESSVRARRVLSGHIDSSGVRRVLIKTPIWHDRTQQGLMYHWTVSYRCKTEILVQTPQRPYGPPGPRWDPTYVQPPGGGQGAPSDTVYRNPPV